MDEFVIALVNLVSLVAHTHKPTASFTRSGATESIELRRVDVRWFIQMPIGQ